jgi:hypothetical protein
MTPEQITLMLGTILGSGAVSTLIVALSERRNKKAVARTTEADYSDKISAAAMKLVDPLQTEVNRLSKQLDTQAEKYDTKIAKQDKLLLAMANSLRRHVARIEYLTLGISVLTKQLISIDQTPTWVPSPWDDEVNTDASGEK